MAHVEYKVTYLKRRTVPEWERFLNHLNATEGWELTTIFRGRPTAENKAGRVIGIFKKSIE